MLDLVTDDHGEDIHKNLTDNEEGSAEQDIAQGPAVVKGVYDKNDLWNHVDDECDAVNDEVEHPERARRIVWEGTNVQESQDCNNTDNKEDEERADANRPQWQGCAIFCELEADKAVE